MKKFLIMFGAMFLNYFLVSVNFRAVAQGLYFWTFISDIVVAANSFLLIKRVSEAKDKWSFIGYTLGGSFGSLLAIFVTKIIYGR